jgi:hypothetical protein
VLAVMLVGLLWPTSGYALEERNGSLEFSYTAPPDPVGQVILNHVNDLKPSISYQVPVAPGGDFTTPWTMLFNADGSVSADTLIVLVNPDAAVTLVITVTLRDAAGVVAAGCQQDVTIGPKETLRRSSRTLFSTCATTQP